MSISYRTLSIAAVALAVVTLSAYAGFHIGSHRAATVVRNMNFAETQSGLRRKLELLELLRRGEGAGVARRLELMASADYAILDQDATGVLMSATDEMKTAIGESRERVGKYCQTKGKHPSNPQLGAPLCVRR